MSINKTEIITQVVGEIAFDIGNGWTEENLLNVLNIITKTINLIALNLPEMSEKDVLIMNRVYKIPCNKDEKKLITAFQDKLKKELRGE